MDANVARRASVSATSTAAGTSVTAPRSRNVAMPPVPISCAAIMRSASPGPRRMRTSPSANIARMKAREAVRNSVIAERPRQRRFFRGQLRRHRLVYVQAVIHELSIVFSGRYRTGQQARQRGEHVTSHAGWKVDRVDNETWSQRQPWIESAPRDIRPSDDGLE